MLKQLPAFASAIFHHAKNLFSGLSLLGAIISGVLLAVPALRGDWSGSLTIGFALLAILGAAFYAWVEAQPPERNVDLRVDCRTVSFVCPRGKGGQPIGPCEVKAHLELQNAGTTPVIIDGFRVVKFNDHPDDAIIRDPHPDEVFGFACKNQELVRTKPGKRAVPLPFEVEAGHRELDWVLQVEIDLMYEDSIELARRLRTLGRFRLDTWYTYRVGDAPPDSGQSVGLAVHGNFDSFKRSVLNKWREHNCTEEIWHYANLSDEPS